MTDQERAWLGMYRDFVERAEQKLREWPSLDFIERQFVLVWIVQTMGDMAHNWPIETWSPAFATTRCELEQRLIAAMKNAAIRNNGMEEHHDA
ncbi:MAG: hypothetical protein RMJ05_03870 [Thermomicrobium sp.]|nr:hypothetical protein [Thermomicrobium sp.]MDW8005834.1 hypothetical protein [Thermomicrobium sp.]